MHCALNRRTQSSCTCGCARSSILPLADTLSFCAHVWSAAANSILLWCHTRCAIQLGLGLYCGRQCAKFPHVPVPSDDAVNWSEIPSVYRSFMFCSFCAVAVIAYFCKFLASIICGCATCFVHSGARCSSFVHLFILHTGIIILATTRGKSFSLLCIYCSVAFVSWNVYICVICQHFSYALLFDVYFLAVGTFSQLLYIYLKCSILAYFDPF